MSGKSELKIFDDLPPQVVVESGYFEDIHTRNSLDEGNAVVEFYIPASNVDYLDLNDSLLSLRVKVVKRDGSSFAATDTNLPTPMNFLMYGLFTDVIVDLNDVTIEGGSSGYPYKAAIESLLNFNSEAYNTQFYSLGYDLRKESRSSWIKQSSVVELVGSLRLDFFSQPKYLIPGVNVRIRLQRSKDDFCLTRSDSKSNDGDWKIMLQQAILYVRRVKVHPAVTKAHSMGLQYKNAIYPYIRTKTVSFT